jgi:hypothetical protein
VIHYNDVKWPNGLVPFYKEVRKHADKILTGTLIAIDPSSAGSSNPGFSIRRGGELISSGEIKLTGAKLPVLDRLELIYEAAMQLTPEAPTIFAIEMIRGAGHFSPYQLHWSIGALLAAKRRAIAIEVPLVAWKAVAKADAHYFKGDAQDAEKIGECLVLLAQRHKDSLEQAS